MALARADEQIVTGVVPPQLQEAMIREVWATLAANRAVMTMAHKLIKSIFLAPFGWLLLAPFWAKRFLGFLPGLSFLTVKYTLTNRRVMVRTGMKPQPTKEIPLNEIGEVRIRTDGNSAFYDTGDLIIQRKDGSTAFEMPGVPEPESFRQTVLQARDAWGPYLKA
jgi:hypothetical protein